MPFFEKNNLIFVHIPKTAGESIVQALKLYNQNKNSSGNVQELLRRQNSHLSKYSRKFKRKIATVFRGKPALGKHSTALEIRRTIGCDKFDSCFRFSVVRNPWDQVVSFYNHLRKPLYLPEYQGKLLHPYNACQFALNHNFREWVIEVYKKKQFQQEMIRKQFPINHFDNQHKWLCDKDDKLLVDFVCRFENLEKDLENVEKKTGINFINMMPHKNKSSRNKDYRCYYDNRTKNIIAVHFSKDIELFNYWF